MISKSNESEELIQLSDFLPSNLLSDIDESLSISSKCSHKESNVSIFFNLKIIIIVFNEFIFAKSRKKSTQK